MADRADELTHKLFFCVGSYQRTCCWEAVIWKVVKPINKLQARAMLHMILRRSRRRVLCEQPVEHLQVEHVNLRVGY